jgi:hypothetical protein
MKGINNTKRYLLFRVAEKNYVQNFYKPTNPQKYIGDLTNIVYRSSYELRSFRWCDSNPSILEWSSESIIIKYFDPTTQKIRRYFPDLFVKLQEQTGDIKRYILEIKPKRQTIPPTPSPKKKTRTYLTEVKTYAKNEAKWRAAENFCKDNGLIFKLVTEEELGL